MGKHTPEENFDKVLKLIRKGVSVKKACSTPGLPSAVTFYNRILKDDSFREKYILAKDIGLEIYADEIIDISDAPLYIRDNVEVQLRRLKVDSRKFILAKLKPKKYGDLSDLRGHAPPDNDKITTIKRIIVDPVSVDDLDFS
jgi:hypothetical protein